MRPITSLVGIQLATPVLAACADFYTAAFGLDTVAHTGTRVGLKGQFGALPQVELVQAPERALVGLSFSMRTADDIDASAAELQKAGVAIVSPPQAGQYGYGFSLRDPDGHVLQFHAIDAGEGTMPERNDRPLHVSHMVLNSPHAERLTDFYRDILGLVESDRYEKGLLTFLRCDQRQHHCLGISPGSEAGLNHFAMECGDLDGLMRCVGRMKQLGHVPIWGPGRHGPGGNIFCYFEDPAGFVPEFTTGLIQIDDPDSWQVKEWVRTPANGNIWDTGGPSERALELMSGGH